MTVAELSGGGRTPTGTGAPDTIGAQRTWPGLQRLLEICFLCSEVELELDGRSTRSLTKARRPRRPVRAAMAAADQPPYWCARGHPLVSIQHRSEAYRFMSHAASCPGGAQVAVKGDPMEVISRSSHVLDRMAGSATLAAIANGIEQANLQMAAAHSGAGLCFQRDHRRPDWHASGGLTWVGLAGSPTVREASESSEQRPRLPGCARSC